MTTTTFTDPDDERPVIIAAHSHWRRIRWADGREQVVSARTAAKLGALDQTTDPTNRRTT